MAFSFGAAASAPAFGAASAPAFGAASAPAFGAASAPAFGAASAPGLSATPSFAFGSTSAFGAPASSASIFGASSTPSLFSAPAASSASAFGASSTPSLFGAASTPSLFGAASTPSLFGAASTPSLFGGASAPATTSAFSFATAAQPTNALGFPGAQPGGALTAAQQPQQLTANAKFDDLSPAVQKELSDLAQEISRYRQDCSLLDQDTRLHDSTALKQSMEEDTNHLKRALLGLGNAIKADDEALADFREKVMRLLRCTESAIRTFQRAKLWREAPQQYRGQLVPPQVQELLSAPVVLPNPYLELAVQGFMDALDSYRQVVCELEAALPPGMHAYAMDGGSDLPLATTLPAVISHMHDYFVHVAAQLEQLHNQVERSKTAFLAQRQSAGDMTNPFADSRRHQHLSAASQRPVVIPPASNASYPHHSMAQGHGAGHPLHSGTAHGPGGMPTPGAFGTPLTPADASAASPLGQSAGAAAADMNRKQSKGRRK